jgi:hypothetical protein
MSLAEIPVEIKVLNVEIIKLNAPERKRIAIHEMVHLHHHKTNEVLERLLDVSENSQIVHDNIKTLKEDVLDVQSHLRLNKSTKHFIDVVDDRIHTVMVDINVDVTTLDNTITKIEEEVEILREDLMHVKNNGDWSDTYKAKHGTRLSIHHAYSTVKQDLEGGDDKDDNRIVVDADSGRYLDSDKIEHVVQDVDSNRK